ncbi:hypothetical protein BRARA_C01240 [Brassica rapa]|uniref:Uncharacterized protein n=1 Tax=Brassica campestris TaxID=3711 RepID=A0A397ZXE2_BRACM|nr:hypothetical protein BRARA_C01240 [Brassica rapa]
MVVPVFDGTHYECWSVKMKTFLKAIDLWDVVETGIFQQEEISSAYQKFEEGYASSSSSTDSASRKQWMEMKDTTALHMIQNALAFEIFPWIASATSSKEAWDLLLVKSLGGPLFQARKLLDLKKEYHNMKMSDTETVHQFTDKLMELVFRMKSCGWEVEDKEVVQKILSSLPLRFNEALVEEAETLSISDLIDFLLVHEYYTKPAQESVEESVTGVEKCLGDKRETSNSSENVSQSKRSIRKVKVSQVASTERPRREEERELKVFLVLISFLVLIYLLF